MKKVENKNIDNVFKHGLEDPIDEIGYESRDWDALEQMLDGGKKRRTIVYWLPILSGVAALLLIVFGWWLFKPEVSDDKQNDKPQVAINQPKVQQQAPVTNQPEKTKVEPVAGNSTKDIKQDKIVADNTVTVKHNAGNKAVITAVKVPASPNIYINNNDAIANNNTGTTKSDLVLTPASQADITLTNTNTPVLAANVLTKPVVIDPNAPISSKWADDEKASPTKNGIQRSVSAFRPQLGLSVIAASELNGTSALRQGNAGSNVGLLFSVGIKKLTITTGAMYSVKPYSADGGVYFSPSSAFKYGKAAVPSSIAVDCRMLDIPINVDYQLYNKSSNKISIGTGLSSYIMTHENYKYTYADPAHTGPAEYNVVSPGRFLFSVMNLQATYQRQINSKFGVSVQPYFKVPLSNIGYSQVKLQSAGLAVGVNWNINSLSKPK